MIQQSVRQALLGIRRRRYGILEKIALMKNLPRRDYANICSPEFCEFFFGQLKFQHSLIEKTPY